MRSNLAAAYFTCRTLPPTHHITTTPAIRRRHALPLRHPVARDPHGGGRRPLALLGDPRARGGDHRGRPRAGRGPLRRGSARAPALRGGRRPRRRRRGGRLRLRVRGLVCAPLRPPRQRREARARRPVPPSSPGGCAPACGGCLGGQIGANVAGCFGGCAPASGGGLDGQSGASSPRPLRPRGRMQDARGDVGGNVVGGAGDAVLVLVLPRRCEAGGGATARGRGSRRGRGSARAKEATAIARWAGRGRPRGASARADTAATGEERGEEVEERAVGGGSAAKRGMFAGRPRERARMAWLRAHKGPGKGVCGARPRGQTSTSSSSSTATSSHSSTSLNFFFRQHFFSYCCFFFFFYFCFFHIFYFCCFHCFCFCQFYYSYFYFYFCVCATRA